MKVIKTVFLAESVTTRSNNLVMITHPKNSTERKKMSPYSKVGRVGGQSIRGLLRKGMESLLLENKISVCHPLSKISITGDRNKDYYEEDLSLHYHGRGECTKIDPNGCILYRLFGDLDRFSNIVTPSIYFYPTTSGNGTATKNINKLFGSVGGGLLGIINNSPRSRKHSHRTYMTTEHVAGVMIEAPLNIILREYDPNQETVILKTLEYIKNKALEGDVNYFLGGMRSAGYGRSAMLPLKLKKKRKSKTKKNQKSLVEENGKDQDEEIKANSYRLQFSMTTEEERDLNEKFKKVIEEEKIKFPLNAFKKEDKEKNE